MRKVENSSIAHETQNTMVRSHHPPRFLTVQTGSLIGRHCQMSNATAAVEANT